MIFRDIEVYLNLVIIEKYTLVILFVSILAEQGQGSQILMQCCVTIQQEEVKHAIVDEVVFAQ